jgi:hypothetical protein
MLKLGYWLMIFAGVLLGGYAAYFVVRIIAAAPGLNLFIKAVILVGAAGLLITLIGLIIERRREKDDYSDDGDD